MESRMFLFLLLALWQTSYSSTAIVPKRPHVVVVGGGFGGFGAAKGLCESGCKVTLIDAGAPSGDKPLLTRSGKPFEAGHKGFWRDYPNIYGLINTDLGLDENEIFTPYTNSSFYSPYGLEATAPLWSELPFGELPSPLGQVLASAQLFTRLPIADRVSLIGLLYAILDYNRDELTYSKYDRMSAHELFLRMGLSKRLVDDFITPTLLVGLFKPPEELSAAIVMDLLYFYAFAHQTSFDVRWMKKGSITECIINPLVKKLQKDYDFTVLENCRVESIELHDKDNMVNTIKYTTSSSEGRYTEIIDDVEACVLAVGSTGMRSIINGSPKLAKVSIELTKAATLGSIGCISVRIWLDKIISTRTPANVFASFEELRGAGGTFFMLDQLQDNKLLWGNEIPMGSVLACDFYNSGALNALSDDDIISLLKISLLPSAVPEFNSANVVDFEVKRYPSAVSLFSPGSYQCRPPLQVDKIKNLVCAGDWVRLGVREHGAKGLCQERAFVSGLEAANQLVRTGVLKNGKIHDVKAVREDEIQVKLGRSVNKQIMSLLSPLNLDSWWVR